MRRRTCRCPLTAILLIAFLLGLTVGPIACSESGPEVTVSLAIDREIEQGDTFAVEVRIDTKTACRGAQCVVTFDPALMRCDEVVEGDLFKDWANANGGSTLLVPLSPTMDNVRGRVPATGAVGVAIMGGGQCGVQGEGVLLSFHFTAMADGTAEPTLLDVAVFDPSGNAIANVEVED